MTWWCFERGGFERALERYVDQAINAGASPEAAQRVAAHIEAFLHSPELLAEDGVRDDDGRRRWCPPPALGDAPPPASTDESTP